MTTAMKKNFSQLRDESTAPFLKPYYEILNRFHVDDYDKAIGAMSDDLRRIVEECTAFVEKK